MSDWFVTGSKKSWPEALAKADAEWEQKHGPGTLGAWQAKHAAENPGLSPVGKVLLEKVGAEKIAALLHHTRPGGSEEYG